MKKLWFCILISSFSTNIFSQQSPPYFKDMDTIRYSTEQIMLYNMLDMDTFRNALINDGLEDATLTVLVNAVEVKSYTIPQSPISIDFTLPNDLIYICCNGDNAIIEIVYQGLINKALFMNKSTYNITITTPKTPTPATSMIHQLDYCLYGSNFDNIRFECTDATYESYRWRYADNYIYDRIASIPEDALMIMNPFLSVKTACHDYSEEIEFVPTLYEEPIETTNAVHDITVCNYDDPFSFPEKILFLDDTPGEISWTLDQIPVTTIYPATLAPGIHNGEIIVTMGVCNFTKNFPLTISSVDQPDIEVVSQEIGQNAVYRAVIPDSEHITTQWYINNELKSEGQTEFIAEVATLTEYSLKLITLNTITGCSNFVEKNISNMLLDFSISTSPAAENDTITIQLGEHVVFQTQGAEDRFRLNWLFRDGFSYEGKNVYHYFNKPGTFRILCQITDQDTGTTYDYENLVVKVLNDNVWEIDLSQSEIIIEFPMKELIKIPYKSAGKSVMHIAFYDKKGVYYFIKDFNIEGEGSLTIRNPLIGKTSWEYFLKIETFSKKTIIKIQKK